MANGPVTWFNAAIDKIAKNVIRLDTDDFYAVLADETQSIDPTFVGASTDCRYADLTGELATANGYTVGGLQLSNTVFSRTANVVKFTCDPLVWVLSGTITYKYLLIFCDNANNDLVGFMDANDAGGSATSSPTAGSLEITPHADGLLGWIRT
jgi:hypothetical protein